MSTQPSVEDYLALSQAAYTANTIPVTPTGWTLIDSQVAMSGMAALAFRNNATSQIVIAYEGTNDSIRGIAEEFNSAQHAANATILWGGTPQSYLDAENFARTVSLNNPGSQLFVTGHSLGGGQASYVQAHASSIISGGAAFAPPAQAGDSLPGDLTGIANEDFRTYIAYGDPVANYYTSGGYFVGNIERVGDPAVLIYQAQAAVSLFGVAATLSAGFNVIHQLGYYSDAILSGTAPNQDLINLANSTRENLSQSQIHSFLSALNEYNDPEYAGPNTNSVITTRAPNGELAFSFGLSDGSQSGSITTNAIGQKKQATHQTSEKTVVENYSSSGSLSSVNEFYASGGTTAKIYSGDPNTSWESQESIYDAQHRLIGTTTVNRDGSSELVKINPEANEPILTTHLGTDGKPSPGGSILGLNATYSQLVTAVADTLATQLISTVLIRDNLPGSVAASAFAHAAIQSSLSPNPLDFKAAFAASVFNVAGGIAGSKVGNEIALALDLPSEVGSIGGSAVGQYLVQEAAGELGFNLAEGGVTPFSFQASLTGAAASYLSSQLANLITPTTEAGQVSGAVASTLVLILAEINPVTAPFAFFAAIFGSNFIGTMIGDLIDSIFGGQPSVGPNASAVMQYNATTNQFEWKYDTHDNGGDPAQVNAMSDAVNGIMNQTLAAIGGHATSFVQDMSLIWFQDKYYFDFNEHYGESYQDVFDTPNEAISAATFQWLRGLRVQDGDPYMEYVLRNSDATTLTGLLEDLTAARDYSLYIQDPFAFNLGLALANDPAKFAAWQSELERAQELKLDKLTTAELDGLKEYGNLTLDDLPHYGTVIGTATNFLGEHGKTYFVRDASGGVSAYQFDERAGVLTQVTALQNANSTPLNVANGTVVIASTHLANGNYQLILEDHSTNSNNNQPLTIQTFDATGKATGAATALTYADGAAFSYAQHIPEFNSDAYWSMWQSNLRQIGYTGPFDGVTPMSWFQTTFGVPLDNQSSAGMLQLLDQLHSVPGALLNGHVIGTANNLLGSGGFDLIAVDANGYVRIHEFNAQGQAV